MPNPFPTDRRAWTQFSLRTLLALVSLCAVNCAVYRLLGVPGILGFLFTAISVLPVIVLVGRDRLAYIESYIAVYGPFLVMATYTLAYIPCSHCKATTWTVLPYGPAIIPVEIIRRALDLERSQNPLTFWLAMIVIAAYIGALTWLNRAGSWWRPFLSLGTTLAVCTWEALVVLALIRA